MTKIKIYLSKNFKFSRERWIGGTTITHIGFLKIEKIVHSGPIRRYC